MATLQRSFSPVCCMCVPLFALRDAFLKLLVLCSVVCHVWDVTEEIFFPLLFNSIPGREHEPNQDSNTVPAFPVHF